MRNTLLILTGALCVAGAAQAQSTFTRHGAGSVTAMNSTGTAVVGFDNQGAFLWTTTGGYLPLGELGAVGVSEDGTVVLGDMTDGAGMTAAGRWTAGTGWVSLGGLIGSSGNSLSSAYGLSGDGNRATGLGWANASGGRAFEWDPIIGMNELPRMSINSSRGNCVSLDGSTIGGWDEHSTGPRRAAIWGALNVEQLLLEDPVTNPEGIGEVFALSSDGTWACGSELDYAFLWSQATGVINFGPLPNCCGGFFDRGASKGVSDNGQRVIGNFGAFGPFGLSYATIWSPSGGYQRLDDALIAAGVDLQGWTCVDAVDISADGLTILGIAAPAVGFNREWFIATLDGPIGAPYCTPGATNSTGVGARISAEGSLTAASNSLTLIADRLPLNSFGYFLNSETQTSMPNPGGSQGTLCLGGTVGRFLQQVQNSGATGTISIVVDLTNMPQPNGPVSVLGGQTWNFQAWYRDANPTVTSNFTDAVSISYQ
jgi:uncharacterized membrane protein